MKKFFAGIFALIAAAAVLSGCGTGQYILNETTFFMVMTNMQYYPEQYVGADIEYDCFVYHLTDTSGNVHVCGVRKCSAEYGCTCGNDTIIGFLLDYDGTLPEPLNQSEDTNEKAWIHVAGTLASANKTDIEIFAYTPDGEITDATEVISFLTFKASSVTEIDDWSNLNYYVTK